MKTTLLLCFVILSFSCCMKKEEVRMPISHTSGTFMKESIKRNQEMNAQEEAEIEKIIKKNKNISYISGDKGYWYFYQTKNSTNPQTPKKGDVAFYEYEIRDLDNNLIYTKAELKPQVYRVDKENVLSGIREGIKLMRKNEKVTFLFPSHLAYGYRGDDEKIGINQPIVCTIFLNNFMPEEEYRAKQERKKPAEAIPVVAEPQADTDKETAPAKKDTITN